MTARRNTFALLSALAASAGAYAVAQHSPSDGMQHGGMQQGGMQQGMKGGGMHHGCMHDECMQGAEGAGACPMAAGGIAEVKVENTKDGAVIRLAAKQGVKVEEVQQMATRIADHLNAAGAKAQPAPAAKPAPSAPAPKH
jgi:hypothetical protein